MPPSATPVYTAPESDSTSIAFVMFTAGLHAEMVPPCETKMNAARAVVAPFGMSNAESVDAVATRPVGAPPGIVTMSGRIVPSGS